MINKKENENKVLRWDGGDPRLQLQVITMRSEAI